MAKKSKKSKDKKPEQDPIQQSKNDREERSQRLLVFQPEFLEDLTFWVTTNRKNAVRLLSLVKEIQRDPFSGRGKPEPLKHQDAKNAWSRRLTEADRIVYSVYDDRIEFIQARYHYGDR